MPMHFRRYVDETYDVVDSEGKVVSTHRIRGYRRGKGGKLRFELEVDAPGLKVQRRPDALDNRGGVSHS